MPTITGLNFAALMFRRRSLSANTLTLLVGNVGSAILAFSLSVIIGRLAGEGSLGTYATVLAWIFPLILLAEFGTNTLVTRNLAASPGQTGHYMQITSRFRLISGGLLTSLIFFAAPFLSDNPNVVHGLRVAAPLLLIEPAFGAYTAVFRAHHAMLPVPLLNLGMLGVQLIFSWVLLHAGLGILAVLAVNTLTSAGRLWAAWFIYRRGFKPAWGAIQSATIPLLSLSRRALPFALAGVLAAAQMRISLILLEPLGGAAQAGYFTAATRFTEAARLVPHAFFDALLPNLSNLAENDERLARTFHRALWILMGFGLLAGVGFAQSAPLLIRLTYGEQFSPAAPVLALAGWFFLFSLVRGGQTLYHYAKGEERVVNGVLGVMLIVHVAAGLWLIPRYGASGAVIAGGLADLAGVIGLAAPWRFKPH